MKMFVPMFVGLYESLFGLGSLGLYMCIKMLEIENFCSTTFGKTRSLGGKSKKNS